MIMSLLSLVGLFEVHGNSNVEKCTKCKHEYLRDFRVVTRAPGLKKHETGVLVMKNLISFNSIV